MILFVFPLPQIEAFIFVYSVFVTITSEVYIMSELRNRVQAFVQSVNMFVLYT